MPRRKPTSNVAASMSRHIVKHGLAGDIPVIPGVESPEEAQAHFDAIIDDWAPDGATERTLAERIADLTWRLRRASRYEVDAIAVARERVDFDFARDRKWDDRPKSVAEARERAIVAQRTLAILENLRDTPRETVLPSDDVDTLLDQLTSHAGLDRDEFLEGVEFADDDQEGWTVADLLVVLRALADLKGTVFSDAMTAFERHARALALGAEEAIVASDKEMDRMKRERLMPGGHELDLILRYETSLNRMLYQTIAELEARQARRKGAAVALPFRHQHYGGRNG